ncbi:uncharacterized protein LOC128609520 [Ictalurus furcatus]|uniref:uncharacterized protein LOC128609520 n=1 Tax=Ictalurus furcatus TaxID=66913 RepID=UPI002350B307|nr:uncharacterized protein LOC128609520 [Ictalurus furcatus]
MVVLKPKPGISASGIRYAESALYRAYIGELPDPSSLDHKAAYADFTPGSLPLTCTMNLSPHKPLMDSIFSKVQAGSILLYKHPPPTPDGVITHKDAPPFPKVPPDGYQLKPTDCTYVPTNREQLHLNSLSLTLSQSHLIEEATRCQSAAPEWHSLRKEKVTASSFREVSHVRGPNAAVDLAERIIQGTRQTADMKRGLDVEEGILKDFKGKV